MQRFIMKLLWLDDESIKKYYKLSTLICYLFCFLALFSSILVFTHMLSVINTCSAELENTANVLSNCLDNGEKVNQEYIKSAQNFIIRSSKLIETELKFISFLLFSVGALFGFQGFYINRVGQLLSDNNE